MVKYAIKVKWPDKQDPNGWLYVTASVLAGDDYVIDVMVFDNIEEPTEIVENWNELAPKGEHWPPYSVVEYKE